jgi:hypothetical protein
MWQRLPPFIREWPILIVGILLIVPFLYLSSFEASPSKSTVDASSLNRNGQSASHSAAIEAPLTNAQSNSRPAPMSAQTAANFAQAPTKAPVTSHDSMAAVPAAQTSG